jgi:hypothetical protein
MLRPELLALMLAIGLSCGVYIVEHPLVQPDRSIAAQLGGRQRRLTISRTPRRLMVTTG